MILIVDNKSAYNRKITRLFDAWGVSYLLHPKDKAIDWSKNISGIILSGGPASPYGPNSLSANYIALLNAEVPVLGICLGHQIIGAAFGGEISRVGERQMHMQRISIDKKNTLFAGLSTSVTLQKRHSYQVSKVPKGFTILAHSPICPVEIMAHKKKKIYGIQGHPEASGEKAQLLLKNFVRLCAKS